VPAERRRHSATAWSATGVDLVVIGAGINGAAVAREGALRGLRTLLVDQLDIASGTSAASSRMIHGGPRYLEHGELRLVRESLRERERLLRSAPHLVTPYPLLIPFYEHNRRRPATLRTGMLAYDALSWDKHTPRHRILSATEVRRRHPGLEPRGLQGAALYVDAHAFLAERLAVEQALDVDAAGGLVLTQVGVTAIAAGGSALELELTDGLCGTVETVRARAVVNATGPWVDAVLDRAEGVHHPRLIGAVKGSYLTVAAFPGAPDTGIHFEARSDGRPILVLPQADGRLLVGSTEVVEECDPGALRCSDAEIAYLLSELNMLVPGAGPGADDVLHSYAGARPLPHDPAARTPASVSRDHHVVAHGEAPGLFSLTGGKLTTHRALGEMSIDRVLEHLRASGRGAGAGRSGVASGRHRLAVAGRRRSGGLSPTRVLPLPGGRTHDWPSFAAELAAGDNVDPEIARRLLSVYGVRAPAVLALAADDPGLGRVIPGTGNVLGAEVALAFADEFAQTLGDVLARRLMLARRADAGLDTAPAVAEACAAIHGWDEDRTRRELRGYRQWTARLRPRAAAAGEIADAVREESLTSTRAPG